ncbi:TPA: hypothetical protein KDX49_004822, partial [Vibrio parahaemolyticus]|nr:hypothetical protein [Vibrio parahaemolyticus]HBH7904739.1 hypothetical protein [Vibrio parahaemolyticus]
MAKLKRASLLKKQKANEPVETSVKQLSHLSIRERFTIPDTNGDLGKAIHLWRVRYNGVPTVLTLEKVEASQGKQGLQSLDMNRDLLLVQLHEWVSYYSNYRTKYNKIGAFIPFVRYSDSLGIDLNEALPRAVLMYSNHLLSETRKPNSSTDAIRKRADAVREFLEFHSHTEALSNAIYVSQKDSLAAKTESYDDIELSKLSSDLYRVYNTLGKAYIKGDHPESPFKTKRRNWDVHWDNSTAWKSKLVISAYFLTAMYIGNNTTPLTKLRCSDIDLKGVKYDKNANLYKITSRKGRDGNKKKPWELGFTKRGFDFFSTYLSVATKLNEGDGTDYLFPYVKNELVVGEVKDKQLRQFCLWFLQVSDSKIQPITRRFRKSKSEGVMTLTNDIHQVAEALNNSIGTAEKDYLHGNKRKNDGMLATASEAIIMTAKGMSKSDAKSKLEKKYGQIISLAELEQQDLKGGSTSVGTRCKSPYGTKSEKQKVKLLKAGLATENDD